MERLLCVEYLKIAFLGIFQAHILHGPTLWGRSSAVTDILLAKEVFLLVGIRTTCKTGYFDHFRPLFCTHLL